MKERRVEGEGHADIREGRRERTAERTDKGKRHNN